MKAHACHSISTGCGSDSRCTIRQAWASCRLQGVPSGLWVWHSGKLLISGQTDSDNGRNMKAHACHSSVPAVDLTPDAPSGKRGLHGMLQGVRSGLWVWDMACSLQVLADRQTQWPEHESPRLPFN